MKDKVDVWNFTKEYWEFMKMAFPLPPQSDLKTWEKITDKSLELVKKWDDKGEFGKYARRVVVDWMEYIGKEGKSG